MHPIRAFSTTLLLLALYLISKGRVPAASAVLGLAATARPGAILLLPLLLVLSGGRKALRLLPALLPILLVWCVNAIKGDPGVIISSQGGINLYLGNSPDSDGMTAFAPFGRVDADRMEMTRNADGQHVLNLTGSVRLVYQP